MRMSGYWVCSVAGCGGGERAGRMPAFPGEATFGLIHRGDSII